MWNLCTESMGFPLRYDCHELRPRLGRRNVATGPHRREETVGSASPLPFGNGVCRPAASAGTGSHLPITTLSGFPGEKTAKSLSGIRLCDPRDCSPPGSSVHGTFQASILEWVAISFSRRSPWPRDRTRVSCIAGRCFTI